MRILFLTPSLPRPDGGGAAIRNWHLAKAANDAGHIVDILSYGRESESPLPGCADSVVVHAEPKTRSARERAVDTVFHLEPDLARRLRSSSFTNLLSLGLFPEDHQAEAEYDAIQVEGLEMWSTLPTDDGPSAAPVIPHANEIERFRSATPRIPVPAHLPPLIYDAHNAEATLQQRTALRALKAWNLPGAAYSGIQWQKLRVYERNIIQRAAATLAVSPSDAAALKLLSGRHVDVVPIGVDTAHYSRAASAKSTPIPIDVVFSGTLDYRPNTDAALWFVRDVWPRIRAKNQEATLAIVGRNPPPHVQRFHGTNGVTITGEVVDDRPYMAGAGVYVLPIRFGAGVRVKLLNAMSMECAIVATTMACEGTDAQHAEHLVATSAHPAAFAAAVVALLDDPDRRVRLSATARALMVTKYDWAKVTPALLAVYERLGTRDG